MSDEHKEPRSLDTNFPGEEQLSRLYREGSTELPPTKLDAAILNDAQQAVRSQPRRLLFLPSRKWIVPLSLAAALWVTLELVLQERTEMTSQHFQALSPSAPQPESSDAIPQQEEQLTEAPSPLAVAPVPLEEKMLAQHKPAELQTRQVPQAREQKHEAREARTRRGIAPASPESRMQPTKPPTTWMVQSKREMEKKETDVTADAAGLQTDATSEQPAQAASDEQEKPTRELAAPTSAPGLLSDAPTAGGTTATEARTEQTLSPKEWLAKIRELRHAGKIAEAEASLKAFKKRYPEYPVKEIPEPAR